MRRYLPIFAIATMMLLSKASLLTLENIHSNPSKRISKNFFIENKGQWAEEVRYLAKIGGMNAWITDEGIIYDFYKVEYDESIDYDSLRNAEPMDWMAKRNEHARRKGHVVKMSFVNSRKFVKPIKLESEKLKVDGINKLEAYYNYFIGNDSTKWASFVPLYEEVVIQNVYKGIDYRLYFDDGLIRYDVIAKPYADLEQFRIKYDGEDGLAINDSGELVIKTSIGDVVNQKLYAYQGNNKIECKFSIDEENLVSFDIEDYDKSLALTIDPLVWSTFIGGGNDDIVYMFGSMEIDNSGNVIIAGNTKSSDFPTQSGSYELNYKDTTGYNDCFITMTNMNGSTLIFSTFLGGSRDDQLFDLAIYEDSVYVTGGTYSGDFPTSSNAYQKNNNGGYDGFISKFNNTGSSLLYSTYIGGDYADWPHAIDLDNLGNPFITGSAQSGFPTTQDAYDRVNDGSDIFICKLSSDLDSIIYSTYLGGSDSDDSRDMVLDNHNNVYVVGYTRSNNFPAGSFDPTFNGGSFDVVVSKLSSDLDSLLYSTYLGGGGDDVGNGIALDNNNNVYITGSGGAGYPTTSGAYDETYNGSYDVIVTKLDSSLSAPLIYSTFIGSEGGDFGCDIKIDSNNNAVITGYAGSGFPTTTGAYDTSYNGSDDVFLCKLNSSGTGLQYSTYIGGSNSDVGYAIDFIDSNYIYLSGNTSSTNFPTTTGAFDEGYNGGINDVFVTKIDIHVFYTDSLSDTEICPGSEINIPFITDKAFIADNIFTAQLSDATGDFTSPVSIGTLSSTSSGTISGLIPLDAASGTAYRIRVISSNPSSIANDNREDLTINTLPNPEITDDPNPICPQSIGSYISNNDPDVDYKWTAIGGNVSGADDADSCDILWGSAGSGTVTLLHTNSTTGCKDSAYIEVTINSLPDPEITDYPNPICQESICSYSSNNDPDVEYKWRVLSGTISGADDAETCDILWGSTGSGTVTLVQTNSTTCCKDSTYLEVTINSLPTPDISDYPTPVCLDNEYTYSGNTEAGIDNKWQVIGGTINGADDGETVDVIWETAGLGTVSLVQTNATSGCKDSVFQIITINPLPTPIISDTENNFEACADNEYEYTSNSEDAILWSAINGTITGASDQEAINVQWGSENSGTLTLIHTTSSGCVNSVFQEVTINQLPEAPEVQNVSIYENQDAILR
ncbi:SBBP repeat-containing protein, partial [Bacteroidota bacterium]